VEREQRCSFSCINTIAPNKRAVMTSQSPRIYLYKITFEEVPYYYYGVKKEKYYNQEYWGSPITNKWCWEFYTPKKQILEFFEYSDEGWLKTKEVEDRLIRPFYQTDKWCLNQNCGGTISLEVLRKSGRKSGVKNYKNKIGIYGRNKEQHSQDSKNGGKKGGRKTYVLGVGAFAISPEKRKNTNIKANETNKINGTGIYSLTKEQQIENGKNWGRKGAKKTNYQKWMCLETGFITNPGNLSQYQKARGIDKSKRVRIE
tara:strand:- start:151 stop:924 length:774 start_codon:yes stop_codon:yes gene_type:complete